MCGLLQKRIYDAGFFRGAGMSPEEKLEKIREIWLRSLPKELPHHTINLTVRRDAREKVFEADNLDEIAKLLFPEEKGDNAKA